MHAKPLARRGLIVGHTSGDECRQLLERHRLALEIAHVQIEDVEWMDVRIDKPRKHQAATQLLEPSLRPYEALCTGRRATENDLAGAGRERPLRVVRKSAIGNPRSSSGSDTARRPHWLCRRSRTGPAVLQPSNIPVRSADSHPCGTGLGMLGPASQNLPRTTDRMQRVLLVAALLVAPIAWCAGDAGGKTPWPTHGWSRATPASVGLDETVLAALDNDLARGKYSLVDTFHVFRCGAEVYSRKYDHDYGKLYSKEAKMKGPLNARLTGRYNYFDPAWHPYYHGTDLHTMQSVSKTVTSGIIGVAITRGDFKSGLDRPALSYFDIAKVKNVDDRKPRMTLQNVLTMTTGLDWVEDVPYDDPRSDSSLMEATDDWVQYAIDKPMAHEP